MSDDAPGIPLLDGIDPPPQPDRAAKAPRARRAGPAAQPAAAASSFLPPLLASEPAPLPVVEAPPPALPQPRAYRHWRILQDAEVPNGFSTFLVHAGQVVSEQWFDVARLQQAKVALEEIPG